jgi:hypothetical protein
MSTLSVQVTYQPVADIALPAVTSNYMTVKVGTKLWPPKPNELLSAPIGALLSGDSGVKLGSDAQADLVIGVL